VNKQALSAQLDI